MQTAHTVPAGKARAHLGAARVYNEIDDVGGRGTLSNTSVEAGVRFGVTDFLDLGVLPLLGSGAAVDSKANVLYGKGRLALAPRLLAGVTTDTPVFVAEAGIIASYRIVRALEPYAALGFSNHWFFGPRPLPEDGLAADESLAKPAGYGDGLVKASLGLSARFGGGFSALVEYDHWYLAQNDPGNGYAFLPSDVIALALAFQSAPSSARRSPERGRSARVR
jgi:hypothetical protein